MSNEVMTRNSEWMNHVVSHLNRMVDNFERIVTNYRPMAGGERFMTGKEVWGKMQPGRKTCGTTAKMGSFRFSNLGEKYSTESPTFKRF